MPRSTAVVATANAAGYLQQLCKHWGHRFAVTFAPTAGRIDFGGGQGLSLAARGERLTLTAEVAETDDLPALERVVAEHLQRFAFRESLQISWQPSGDA